MSKKLIETKYGRCEVCERALKSGGGCTECETAARELQFTRYNKTYIAVESPNECKGCTFNRGDKGCMSAPRCFSMTRNDGKDVIFKLSEDIKEEPEYKELDQSVFVDKPNTIILATVSPDGDEYQLTGIDGLIYWVESGDYAPSTFLDREFTSDGMTFDEALECFNNGELELFNVSGDFWFISKAFDVWFPNAIQKQDVRLKDYRRKPKEEAKGVTAISADLKFDPSIPIPSLHDQPNIKQYYNINNPIDEPQWIVTITTKDGMQTSFINTGSVSIPGSPNGYIIIDHSNGSISFDENTISGITVKPC